MISYLKKKIIPNLFLLGAVGLVGLSTYHAITNFLAVREEQAKNRKTVEELTKKKSDLEAYIAELQTNEAVEREAKERLNLKKSGEEVVVVVPPKTEEKKHESSLLTFWQKVKKFILGSQ